MQSVGLFTFQAAAASVISDQLAMNDDQRAVLEKL